MSKAVIYYTLGGTSRKLAEVAANMQGCDCIEVKEVRKRNIITAFIPGCPQALHQKQVPIQPLPELNLYSTFEIYVPIWAGLPAPAFNSVIAALPKGADVTICAVSGGGETPKGAPLVKQFVEKLGLRLVEYKDIKAQN